MGAQVVTVVIPVWNDAGVVGLSIGSALAQTWSRVEVVVVDDGSTDDLEAALRPFGERIRVVKQENRGLAAARNTGVAAATGEVVQFLDADDVLRPDAVASWMEALRNVPDAELAFGAVDEVDTTTGALLPRRWAPTYKDDCPTQGFLESVVRRYPFLPGAVAVPRALAVEVPFDERLRYMEDNRWWFQLAWRGTKVAATPHTVLEHSIGPGRLSSESANQDTGQARTWLMGLDDLLATPPRWPLLAPYLPRGAWAPVSRGLERADDPWTEELRSAVLARIAALGDGRSHEGLSPAPPLVLCAELVANLERWGHVAEDGRFHRRFAEAVRVALRLGDEPGHVS